MPDLAAWRTFGHGSDRQAAIGSPTDKDEDQPPDPTLLFTSGVHFSSFFFGFA